MNGLRVRVLFCTAILVCAQTAKAEPPEQEYGIIVRVSRELFVDKTQEVIDLEVPIDKTLDGKRLVGKAKGKANTKIEVETSDDHAEFLISMDGSGSASATANFGPAVARMSSRARFTVQSLVKFDGVRYRAEPATAVTRNCTTVDRICPKRRGPVGLLVKCVGRRKANKSEADLNKAAEDWTTSLLAEKLDKYMVDFVEKLNETSKFHELVAKYFPETKDWKYRLKARPHFLLAGFGPAPARFPEFLKDPDTVPDARLELWLKLTPGQAAMLKLVGELGVTHDLIVDHIQDKERAEQILDEAKLIRQGEWTVIQLGGTASEDADAS